MKLIWLIFIMGVLLACNGTRNLVQSNPGSDDDIQDKLDELESLQNDYLVLREEYANLKKKSYATEKGLRDLVYRYDSLYQAFYELKQNKIEIQPRVTANSEDDEKKELKELAQRLQKRVWDLEMQLDQEYIIPQETQNQQGMIDTGNTDSDVKQISGSLVESNLRQVLKEYINDAVFLDSNADELLIRLPNDFLFQDRIISAEGGKVIFSIANVIKNLKRIDIMVIGHSDSNGSYGRNWEQSLDNALAVVQSMIRSGCSPLRITAAGKGPYAELANRGDTAETANNRVEIKISNFR